MELVARSIYSKVSRIALQKAPVAPCAANFVTTSSTNQAACTKTRTELDYEELSDLLTFSEDIALIDVRNPQELSSYGSIPGAINIPLGEVKAALQLSENEFRQTFFVEKPSKSAKNLVFFARGPNASSAAVEIAHRLGYKGSRQYSGGWEDYCNKTGLPLKKKPEESVGGRTKFMGHATSNVYRAYPF